MTTQLFLNKIPYTLPLFQKKLALSIAEASILETSIFYHIFTSFHRGWGMRYFKQISTSSKFSKISILLHKRLYISCSFRKKLAVSIANVFRDIHVLPFFLSLLTVSEVCHVSNKYWLPDKSATKIFLHKIPYTPPSFKKKHSPSQKLLEILSIYHIYTSLHSPWGVQHFK